MSVVSRRVGASSCALCLARFQDRRSMLGLDRCLSDHRQRTKHSEGHSEPGIWHPENLR